MKKLFVFIFVLLFTANSYVVATWASSCPHEVNSIASKTTSDMPVDMPCHDEGNKKITHCDDICYCAHVTTSPTTIIGNTPISMDVIYSFEGFSVYQNIFVSFISTPQGPPPKSFA